MNQSEAILIRRGVEIDEATVSVADIADPQKDRTLIFGYLRDYSTGDEQTHTFHVYMKDGLIHRFIYDYHKNTMHYGSAVEWVASELTPGKRAYPESTEFAFARLLQLRGVDPNLTTYDESRAEKVAGLQYHGLIH